MIETIYSNGNEDNKTSKAATAFKMPKNIRQVGKSSAARKIYVEDYVMSFIKQLVGEDYSGCTIAVLVGQCIRLDNCRNIFISGAVRVNSAEMTNDIVFTNDIWTSIYEEIKKYFVETEIVGWYIGGPGYLMTEEDRIQKIHIDNFAGQDKVLLMFDNMEKEEAFFCYENGRMTKQDGYYIYYEKNEEMQSYIIEHKQPESCEANYDDKVSRDIRTVIQNKKPAEEENKNVTRLLYAAGMLLAVIILVVGVAMLRNYDQMKSMQETLNYLSKNIENVTSGKTQPDSSDVAEVTQPAVTKEASGTKTGTENSNQDTSGEDALDVQVVPGNVKQINGSTSTAHGNNSKDNDNGEAVDKELAGDGTDAEDISDSDLEKAAEKDDGSKAAEKKDPIKTPQKDDNSKTVKKDLSYYTVKEGDTLADISFDLYKSYSKVKKIMELNGIDNQDLIYVGQKLIVP